MDITVEEYFNNDQIRCDIFRAKYLKTPTQTLSDCFTNIIDNICSIENNVEDLTEFKNKVYSQWINGDWRVGGSIIASANKPDKNISTFNCSGLVIEDDTLESIYKAKYEATKMAAYRQGFGVNFDVLRPKGLPINNSAEVSGGAIHWMKSFDQIGNDAGQKSRFPAMLFALTISHPDIEEFITVKDNLNLINNANLTVFITNDFMEAVKADKDWEMSFKLKDGTLFTKTINAKKLFNMISDRAWKQGEPGVYYIDTANDYSIQKALGHDIKICNACGEKPIPNKSVCCLAPLNMEMVPHLTNDIEFHKWLKETVDTMVRFMDNVIQYEIVNSYKSPISEQLDMVKNLREIGLGITNLHKWLYDQGLAYDSDDAISATSEFFKWYLYYTFKASCELAKLKGPCPAWQSQYDNGTLENNITKYLHTIFDEFPELKELYLTIGIRNGALLSIAPTGTTSLTFKNDCLSSGIEPTIGYAYWRKTRAISQGTYDYYFILPSAIKDIILNKINNSNTLTQDDINDRDIITNFTGSVLDQDGNFGKIIMTIVNKWIDTDKLLPAHKIDPFKKIKLMAAVQKYCDAAISVTYNLPFDYPKDDVAKLYMAAYDNNLKSMTVYRDGSREGILIFEDPITYKNKFEQNIEKNINLCKDRPSNIVFNCAPKRENSIKCDIHHPMVRGEEWIVLIGLHNNLPYEIFAGKKNDDFNISKNVTTGTITKRRNGKYTLTIEVRKSHIEYDDITELFMNEEYQALTRMISLSLRHGVYHEFIISQLKKSSNFVGDFVAVVSRVLNKYVKEYKFGDSKNVCQICGHGLIRESGCVKCSVCDYSRCG